MPDIPNAQDAYAEISAMSKKMRLQYSKCELRDLEHPTPLLDVSHTTRTFLHPEEGIVTIKEGQRLIAGCGHLIESMSGIGCKCPGRRHRKDPLSAITCVRCVRRCAGCGVTYCAACTKYDQEAQLYFCNSCYRLRAVGKTFRFMGILLGLIFFEPTNQEEQ